MKTLHREPGQNYQIVLEPREEVNTNQLQFWTEETGWLPIKSADDEDDYTFENGSRPRKKRT